MRIEAVHYRCDCTEWDIRRPPARCPRCRLRPLPLGAHALWDQPWFFHQNEELH